MKRVMYSKTSVLRLKKVLTFLVCTWEAPGSNIGCNAHCPDPYFFLDFVDPNSDAVFESKRGMRFSAFSFPN
jgi:hypothetical protein